MCLATNILPGAEGFYADARTASSEAGRIIEAKRNSLNFLRLVLALMVVLSHSFVGGFTDPLLLNHTSLGDLGVYGFFAISSYLIASSASHNSLGRYLWQRFLRIFPAIWVCLVMAGFVFAALAWVTVPKSHPPCGFSACYLGSPTGPFQYIYQYAAVRSSKLVDHRKECSQVPKARTKDCKRLDRGSKARAYAYPGTRSGAPEPVKRFETPSYDAF